MSKFKVGDRVALYNPSGRSVGIVTDIDTSEERVKVDVGTTVAYWWAHYKQCRKLKPKAPLREYWINIYPGGPGYTYSTEEDAHRYAETGRIECLLVREVRSKKK